MAGGTGPTPVAGGGPVRAAGGVVWRPAAGGGVEVLVVHRPGYDDWTLPKGRAEPGETDEGCALREVEEETGLRCRMGLYLGEVEYLDRHGRTKVARYWAMEPESGSFTPGAEVDEVRWVTPADARRLLSYPRDAGVLAALAAAGPWARG